MVKTGPKMFAFSPLRAALPLAAALCAASAFAQAPLDAPPPLPAADASAAPATPAKRAGPRKALDATVERARAEELAQQRAREAKAAAPEPLTEPPDDKLLPPARVVAPETRIEQKRQGNRVVEITVTPQGSSSSYVIVNREGRPPLSNQELSSGLSTPRFLRFDF